MAGVQNDAVAYFAGVDGVEDVAGFYVEPFGRLPAFWRPRQHAQTGLVIVIPAVGGKPDRRVEDDGQIHENRVVCGDGEIVHHGGHWHFNRML